MRIDDVRKEIAILKQAGKTPRAVVCTVSQWAHMLLEMPAVTAGSVVDFKSQSDEVFGLPVQKVREWSGAHVLDKDEYQSFLDRRS